MLYPRLKSKSCKMTKLKIILFFSILSVFCSFATNAQQPDKKSKYVYPIIESDSAFQIAIQSHEYVVVDFWAVWCKPCQMFIPEYEEIAKKLHKKIAFYKLNIDKCQPTAHEYDAKLIPVIIIFKNGKEVKRYVGLTAKERIIFDLEEIIKNK